MKRYPQGSVWVVRSTNIRAALAEVFKELVANVLPQASWETALRRGLVVALLVGAGVISGNTTAGMAAAFGALQVGLVVVPMSRARLIAYLTIDTLAAGLACLAVLAMGGTWWSVPIVVAIALATGALSRTRSLAYSIALNTVVIAVLFAPRDDSAAQVWMTTLALIVGSTLQGLAMLAWWRRDRHLAIGQRMANEVASLRRLVVDRRERGSVLAHSIIVEEDLNSGISLARLSPVEMEKARDAAAWLSLTRRGLVRWLEIRDPSLGDRQQIGVYLSRIRLRLMGLPVPLPHSVPEVFSLGWQCGSDLKTALVATTAAIRAWLGSPGRGSTSLAQEYRDLLADTVEGMRNIRSGLRLGLAVLIAEIIAHAIGTQYSFWIPLTVVFIVQTNWSYTLIRTLLRIAGTVLAVLLMGYLIHALPSAALVVITAAFIFSTLTVKYMSGNYAVATFAITSFILTINTQFEYRADVIEYRFLFTLIAAVIGIAAALLWPAWRGPGVLSGLSQLISSLATAIGTARSITEVPSDEKTRTLVQNTMRCRDAVLNLVPEVTGAVLEPVRGSGPVPSMLDSLDRSQRALAQLLALDAYVVACAQRAVPSQLEPREFDQAQEILASLMTQLPKPEEVGSSSQQLVEPLQRLAAQAYPAEAASVHADELVRIHLLQGRFHDSLVALGDSIREMELSPEVGPPPSAS